MRPFRSIPTLLGAVLCASSLFAAAQNAPVTPAPAQAAPAPQFDVTAVHPHEPLPHERSHISDSDGRFTTENVSLRAVIQWAFDLPKSRIIGGPSWIGTLRWDIEAKADKAIDTEKNDDAAAANEENRRMVQSLLAERFHLATHRETRELPVYALVVAKSGPKLTATQAGGTRIDHETGSIRIDGGDDTVAVLAGELAAETGRIVIDKTGIQGRYKLALTWTPDDRAAPVSGGEPSAAATADSGPSIFTALEEQLGLKLESEESTVEVLVIDDVEVPSAN